MRISIKTHKMIIETWRLHNLHLQLLIECEVWGKRDALAFTSEFNLVLFCKMNHLFKSDCKRFSKSPIMKT
jgi:hypothetical protein